MKVILTALAILSLISCGNGPRKEEPLSTLADGSDLTKSVTDANAMVSKVERALRKVRLAQDLIAKKFSLTSVDFSACVLDTAPASRWELKCPTSQTQGLVDFLYSQNALSGIDLESSTPVKNFGNAKEILEVSEVIAQSEADGTQVLSFKLSWSLFKDSFATSAQVCGLSAGRFTLKAKEGKLRSLTNNRLTLECRDLAGSTNSMTVDLTGINLTFSEAGKWIGEVPFQFQSTFQNFNGQFSLKDSGVTYSGSERSWQCAGSGLCFP